MGASPEKVSIAPSETKQLGWSYEAGRGSNQSRSSGTTLSATLTGTIPVGDFALVLAGSYDTLSGTTTHSMSDTNGHTWTEARIETAYDKSISVWITEVTSELGTSDSVTLTTSQTTAQRGLIVHHFSGLSGFSVSGSDGDSNINGRVDMSISNLTNQEYLWIGLGAQHESLAVVEMDSDYTLLSGFGIGGGPVYPRLRGDAAYRIYSGTS